MSSYTNLETSSPWVEKRGSNRRQKWTVIGSLLGIAALIAAGVIAGVVISKQHKSSSSSAASQNGNSPVVSDPNDPSNFEKNPQLKKSFFGIAYTPLGSQLPECGATLDGVIEDIQLISQLTDNVRLYGPDCNQTFLVLDAIQRTKVNMTVWVGLYPVIGNDTILQNQLNELEVAFKTFGVDNIDSITVGNELMLNYLTANSIPQEQINSAAANVGATQVVDMINTTKQWWNNLGFKKPMRFCNCDAGSYFNSMVLNAVDCALLNVHPFFAGVPASEGASWVDTYTNSTIQQDVQGLTNIPEFYIGETGWPSGANDTAHDSDEAAIASISGLQTYLDTFVCQANDNNTRAFFFEAMDEPWKKTAFGGVEGDWGLMYANKTLKPVTLPECTHIPSNS